MPTDIQEIKTDTWNALLYICSVLAVLGMGLVIFFTLALCRRLRRNKKIIAPPTPPVRRNLSLSTIYPPSPHAIKLPNRLDAADFDNVSILEVEAPSYFSTKQQSYQQQEVKLSPLVLDALQGHSLEIRRSSSGSHLIRIPKFIGDLPSIHGFLPPPPPYSPSMARNDSLRDTFLTLT